MKVLHPLEFSFSVICIYWRELIQVESYLSNKLKAKLILLRVKHYHKALREHKQDIL